MANIEENPTQEAEFEQKEESKKLTPQELIEQHKAEIEKINVEFKKLSEDAQKHQAAINKIKESMLSLGTIRSERIGAIKGLKELVDG